MGYRTGAKVLLLFMFGFFFLGYTPFLSVCLGAIAGLTSGFISSWWHAKEDYITDEATGAEITSGETSASGAGLRPRGVRYGFGVRSARNASGSVARPSKGVGWLFRRNR
ncbi:MAG: hypothetical protein NW224_17890 [Leptolyngbyaceae cyanobacterium bins.302]|nr:hypothetical protein [Leptolyngbyaceae cyanobacterium bins.302]